MTTATADQDAIRVANRYAAMIQKATTLTERARACEDAATRYRCDARANQESAEHHRQAARTIRDAGLARQHTTAARAAEAEAARETLAACYYEAQAETYQTQTRPETGQAATSVSANTGGTRTPAASGPAAGSGTAPGAGWRVGDDPRQPGILTLTDTDGSTTAEMTRDELFELIEALNKLAQYGGVSYNQMKLERGGEIWWSDWEEDDDAAEGNDGSPRVRLSVFGDDDTSASLTLTPDALDDLRSRLDTQLQQQRDADDKARAGNPPQTSQQTTSTGTTVQQTAGAGWCPGPDRKPGLLAVTGSDATVEVPMHRHEVSDLVDILLALGVGSASTNQMTLESGDEIWWGEWDEGDDGTMLMHLSVFGADGTSTQLALDPHALNDLRVHLRQQLDDDTPAPARTGFAGSTPGHHR